MSQLIDYNREGKDLLNATLSSIQQGVMWISENGKILKINTPLLQTLGYSSSAAYGMLIYEVDVALDRISWEKQIVQLERKKEIIVETNFITNKGIFFPVHVTYTLVNHDGLYFVNAVVDNDLQENRYKKLLALNSSVTSVGAWLWDNVQKKLTTDSNFFDILEILDRGTEAYKVQQLSVLVQEYLDDKNRSLVIRGLHQIQTEGKSFDEEIVLNLTDNKKRTIRLQAKALLINNRVTAIEGTIYDLDNIGGNKEELDVSKFALDKSADMVFWIDSDARVKYANEAVTRLLGYGREELLNMKVFDFVPDFKVIQWKERWKQLQEQLFLRIEGYNRCKDGSVIPVESYMNYLNYKGREYNCVTSRDMSLIKTREVALKAALSEVENLKDRLLKENNFLKAEQEFRSTEIISNSPKYHQVLRQLGQVAVTDATVLITGETGTGKELLARAVHNISTRNQQTLVKVNCAALPENLIESELFGHEKGAFTGAVEQKIGRFELADGGTIFLDEIGELPLDLQAKLLRVLQEGEFERLGNSDTMRVDVRIIAATNRNLLQLIQEKKFREDLYYRLNVFPIENIPLRERKEDIPYLVDHFIQKFSNRISHNINGIQAKSLKKLMAYDFPGNIRELENIIERAMILSKGNKLSLGHWLPPRKKIIEKEKDFPTFEEIQKRHIIAALKKTKWRVSGPYGAAKILGMNSKTLESKMRKFEINRNDFLR